MHSDSSSRSEEQASFLHSSETSSSPLLSSNSDSLARRVSIFLLVFTTIVGLICIAIGVYLYLITRRSGSPRLTTSLFASELGTLSINGLVTLCTEAAGYVHGIALRSALLAERRLHFNTNGRLFAATQHRRWTGPNGIPGNLAMTVLLMLSFASASAVWPSERVDELDGGTGSSSNFYCVPFFTLGLSLLLQTSIALYSLLSTHIVTWDTTALCVTFASFRSGYVHRTIGRSMCDISYDNNSRDPKAPSFSQISAWKARYDIRRAIMLMCLLSIPYAVWDVICMQLRLGAGSIQWTFLDTPMLMTFQWDPTVNWVCEGSEEYSRSCSVGSWTIFFGITFLQQGTLAVILHLTGLVANTLQDERNWRQMNRPYGLVTGTNAVQSLVSSPFSILLLLAKPFLHWMLGLTFKIDMNDTIGYNWLPTHILNFFFALAIIISFFTLFALGRPKGPQPSTYGHVQTLTNLMDEWPTEGQKWIYWGHKGFYESKDNEDMHPNENVGEKWRHAGTSSKPLAPVSMNALYA